MNKRIFACLCLALVLFIGCNTLKDVEDNIRPAGEEEPGYTGSDTEPEIYQLEEELKLYNALLDVAYTIPKGWWVWDIQQNNVNEDPQLTASRDQLSMQKDETGLWFDMFSVSNNNDTTSYNHLYIRAYADLLDDGIAVEDFTQTMVAYYLEDEQTILEQQQYVDLNGRTYYRVQFKIGQGEEYPYYEDYYILEQNGYFISHYFLYWEEYEERQEKIEEFLNTNLQTGI